MDVNEQIARAYFEEVHSYVVKTNLYFKKIRKRSAGPTNIDLVMVYPRRDKDGPFGKRAICSVKGWQSYKISLKQIQNRETFEGEWRIFEKDELDAAEDCFGTKDFGKILILPPIRRTDVGEAKEYCRSEYGIRLLDFSEVLIELLVHLGKNDNSQRSYDSEVLQTLRMVVINLLQIEEGEIVLKENLVKFLGLDTTPFHAKMWRGSGIRIQKTSE